MYIQINFSVLSVQVSRSCVRQHTQDVPAKQVLPSHLKSLKEKDIIITQSIAKVPKTLNLCKREKVKRKAVAPLGF